MCLCQSIRIKQCVLFVAQQFQLVLVFSEQSLESQVLADDWQNLPQQIPLPQTLEILTVKIVWKIDALGKVRPRLTVANLLAVNA